MSAVGFSKLTKSTIDDELRPRIEALELDVAQNIADQNQTLGSEVDRLEGEITAVSTRLAADVATLRDEATAEQTRVDGKFTAVRSELATDVATLRDEATAEQTRVNRAFTDEASARVVLGESLTSSIKAVEASFNNWVASNTDEIAGEVDKAILARVNQDTFDAAVEQLSNADSTLNQAIADNLNARLTQDQKHSESIERLMQTMELLLSTYHLEIEGSVVSTPRTYGDLSHLL